MQRHALNQEGVTSKDIFVELPITVNNSSLVSAMFQVLETDQRADRRQTDRLAFVEPDLLERNLEFMMDSVDEYHGKIYQVSQYHRMSARHELQHQQWLQKRRQENAARRAAGDDPLTEEDPNYAPLTEPSRMGPSHASRPPTREGGRRGADPAKARGHGGPLIR